MDGFSTASSASGGRFITLLPSTTSRKKENNWCLPGRRSRSSLVCLANRDGGGKPEFDKWDQMELKFGRLLGEDPKLTLAKIMGRKANPDASYLEIEKSFLKKKGQIDYGKSLPSPRSPSSLPAPTPPRRSVDDNRLNLLRPAMDKKMKAAKASEKPIPASLPQSSKPIERIANKDDTSKVALRKPAPLQGDDIELEKPSKFRIKPNLVLTMKKGPSDSLSDVTLLKKPEVVKISPIPPDQGGLPPSDSVRSSSNEVATNVDTFLSSPTSAPKPSMPAKNDAVESAPESLNFLTELLLAAPQVALHGKPQRSSLHFFLCTLVGSPVKETSDLVKADPVNLDYKDHDVADIEPLPSVKQEVSFGSLIGFLPYRNIGAKWKFLAFESWLRKKGLDPSLYRQKLSIMGSYEVQKKSFVESNDNLMEGYRETDKLTPDMKFEELLDIYDQEKIKFLSSFIGQVIRVSVVLVDQKSRKLIFSGRPKEKEEMVERKRSLMYWDVVKCCVKKITYFGIFVEVEGVPALIHQSEISWDGTLDPSSFFQIGEIVDAKVHQLDYALERITLTLKEIMPDPLNEALESVVGDHTSLGGAVEIEQEEAEWADVESLIEELQKIDGVVGVSKGRFFLSPGLTPTFQVYMASMYDNQYKLLARYGNKVQEVLVQSSMDKEQMKAAILACTNRVE
ncbi:unnamed protein product [Spirodela intermedia]|uniref:S1 motif domain-containing protein n=1 Tax=Spirodela intermedia TaxID=51605 RepID=A0A7I8J951_SPIIN|nr:unnamed protein product [Spirodela intermedia]CAA6666590.1 unnamed protein product [Spirodela intermedia]